MTTASKRSRLSEARASRTTMALDFDDPIWLRLGFVNDRRYNWTSGNDVTRATRDRRFWMGWHRWHLTMPWFEMIRIPADYVGGTLCWRGTVLWESENERFTRWPGEGCRAIETADAGRRVILLDQEPEANLGGQAFWSLGGLFLVDSPEQRRMGIKDSYELALQDWMGSAQFDRVSDYWPRRWAEAYVAFAAGEKRSWLAGHGVRFLPTVGWAERGGLRADGHGNSVPRFHVTWGTGPAVVAPFIHSAHEAAAAGLLRFHHRHRVDELVVTGARHHHARERRAHLPGHHAGAARQATDRVGDADLGNRGARFGDHRRRVRRGRNEPA